MNILDIKELTFAYPDSNDDSGERYLPDALKNWEVPDVERPHFLGS